MSEDNSELIVLLQHSLKYETDLDSAIADFTSAIQLNPIPDILANLYLARGCGYGEKGDNEHAVADYSEAIRLKPTMVDTYEMRGRAYKRLKFYDQAISDYSQGIQLESNRSVFIVIEGTLIVLRVILLPPFLITMER